MAPRSSRLTVTQFAQEVFEHRSPLLYAIAFVCASIKAGDLYQSGSSVPDALVIGVASGLGLFVYLCVAIWFTMRIRGM